MRTLQPPSKLFGEAMGAEPAGMTVDASIASAASAVAGRIVWERVIASSVRFGFRCDED
jgi:hypothetical protein